MRKTILILLLAAWPAIAGAHHSHASLDQKDVRTYSGVVTRYSWTMPHVFLKVRGPDESGNLVEYAIEMNHPPSMAKKGWSRDSFKAGDRITWSGPHDRNPERHYTGMLWAERGDGRRFDMDDEPDGQVALHRAPVTAAVAVGIGTLLPAQRQRHLDLITGADALLEHGLQFHPPGPIAFEIEHVLEHDFVLGKSLRSDERPR